MFRRAGFAGNSIGCRPPGTPLFTTVQRLYLAFLRYFRAFVVEVCAFCAGFDRAWLRIAIEKLHKKKASRRAAPSYDG